MTDPARADLASRIDWADQLRSIHTSDPEMPHLCQMCGAEDGDYPCSTLDYINDDLVRERLAAEQRAETLAAEVARLERVVKTATRSLTLIRDTSGSNWQGCEAEMALRQMAFHAADPQEAAP